jgi:hypothetical protein
MFMAPPNRWTSRVVFFVIVLATLVFAGSELQAQSRSKRLILKDGSYQPAQRWEMQGDRVRYFSAERYEWEELPTSLIDWPATEKYEKELEASAAEEEKRMATEDESERKEEEAKSPTVAPGVQLPDMGGVYLLDTYQSKPELIELVQSGGEIHKNMGRTILSAAVNPISFSTKQTIEIPGARCRVQAHSTQPAIYLDINESAPSDDTNPGPDKPDAAKPDAKKQKLPPLAQRFRIVQLEKKKDSRVIGNLKIMFYGSMSQQENLIPTEVEQVTSEWIKVTPQASLKPGEYAVAEMLGEKEMNLFVWDFGVDPTAPENPSAWVPVQPKTTPTGTDETPILQSRPH